MQRVQKTQRNSKVKFSVQKWCSFLCLFVLFYIFVYPPRIIADGLPAGGTVVAGDATISCTDLTMNVDQKTDKAIIHWDTFNVGSSNVVNFNQPSSSSVVLNRILQTNPSNIQGTINAPGTVILINPAGILFSKNSKVNVGSLIASTMNMESDEGFMKGKYSFSRLGSEGMIINEGTLTAADRGMIALLAPTVRNEGIIRANMGSVVMSSGEKVTFDFDGDELIKVAVDPSTVNALVENKGLVESPGGKVYMLVSAKTKLVGEVINSGPIVTANSIRKVGGKVYLEASHSVHSSKPINAPNASGETVTIKSGKSINVERESDVYTMGAIKFEVNGDNKSNITIGRGVTISSTLGSINFETRTDHKEDIIDIRSSRLSAPKGIIRFWTCGDVDTRDASITAKPDGIIYNPNDAIIVNWTGGGGNNFWATAANWSSGAAPNTSAHQVTIDVNGANVTTAAAYTIGYLSIGTANQSTLTLGDALTIQANGVQGTTGSLTVGPNGTFDPANSLTTIGGNFVVSGGGTIRVGAATYAENYSKSPTTLNAGSTVVYNRNGNQTVSDGFNYSNVAFLGGGTKTMQWRLLEQNINIGGNLTIGAGVTFNARGHNINITGNWLNQGVFTHDNRTVTFNGIGAQSIRSNGANFYNVVVNGAGAIVTLLDAFTVARDLTVTQGTFDPVGFLAAITNNFTVGAAGTIRVGAATYAGNYSKPPTTITAGSTVAYNLNGAQTVSSAFNYSNLTISVGGVKTLAGDITVNNFLTVNAGTFDPLGFLVTINGLLTINVNGTLRVGAATFAGNYGAALVVLNPNSTVDYTAIGAVTIANLGVSYHNLSVSGGGVGSIKTIAPGVTMNGNAAFFGAIQTSNNENLNIPLNLTLLGDVNLEAGNGAITVTGTTNGAHILTATTGGMTTFVGAIGGITPLTRFTVVHNATLHANVSTINGYITIGGNLTLINNVTLDAGNHTITIVGDTNGAHVLTATTTGDIELGMVGGGTPLTGLTTNNAAHTRFDANVTVNNGAIAVRNLVLGGNVALAAGNGAITVVGTTDGTTANTETLTVDTTGAVLFTGVIGGVRTLHDLVITNSAALTFTGAVNLGNALTQTNRATGITTFGGAVAVDSATLLGAAYAVNNAFTSVGAVTVNNTGIFTLSAVGAITANGGFTTTGNVTLHNNVTTANNVLTIGGNLILGANAQLAAGNGAITVVGTTDGTTANTETLTVDTTGAVLFTGVIGGVRTLHDLVITNGTITLGAVATLGHDLIVNAGIFNPNGHLVTIGNDLNVTGTIKIPIDTFAHSYAVGGNVTLNVGSTVDYNAPSNQEIAAYNYGNLTVSTGGIKTVLNGAKIMGRGTIADSAKVLLKSTAVGYNKTYDGTTTARVDLISDNIFVRWYEPAYTYSAVFSNPHVGNAKSIAVNVTGAGLYYSPDPGVISTNANIIPAALTIQANDQIIPAGFPIPKLTVSYKRLVGGDTSSVVKNLQVSTAANANMWPGQYPIIVSNGTAQDYDPTFQSGTLTVMPGDGGHDAGSIYKFTSNSIPTRVNVFQLHGTDVKGKPILKKKIGREKLSGFIANLNPCDIYMEACGSSNYWGRKFIRFGHRVKLVNPKYVKPFVKRNKNDTNDAEGIAAAAMSPSMSFCDVKTKTHQDIQSTHRIRNLLVQQRTALANQLRGLLSEYGCIITKGTAGIRKKLPAILGDNLDNLSVLMLSNIQIYMLNFSAWISRLPFMTKK
jgi:filamentous hemagglutinin family protein